MTHTNQPKLTRPDGFVFYPTGRRCVISIEKALALFGKDGDVEPISFLSKDNFAMVFETEPENSCFWCGEPISGKKSDVKRLKAVENYEPCNACKTKWSGSCTLSECDFISDRAVNGVTVKCDGLTMFPTGRIMHLDFKETKRLLGITEPFAYIPANKFNVLSGEDKPIGRNSSKSNTSKKSSLLSRNDDN
jgi:hypothetical protein